MKVNLTLVPRKKSQRDKTCIIRKDKAARTRGTDMVSSKHENTEQRESRQNLVEQL